MVRTIATYPAGYVGFIPQNQAAWFDGEYEWHVHADASNNLQLFYGREGEPLTQVALPNATNVRNDARCWCNLFGRIDGKNYLWQHHSGVPSARALVFDRWELTPNGLANNISYIPSSANSDRRFCTLTFDDWRNPTEIYMTSQVWDGAASTQALPLDISTHTGMGGLDSPDIAFPEVAKIFADDDGITAILTDNGEPGNQNGNFGKIRTSSRPSPLTGDWNTFVTHEGNIAGAQPAVGDGTDKNYDVTGSHTQEEACVQTDDKRIWHAWVANGDLVNGAHGPIRLVVKGSGAADGMTLVTQNIIPDGSDAFGLTVSTDGDRLIFIYAKQNNGVKDPYLRSRVYRTSTSEWGDERVVGEVQAGHTLTRMTSTDRVLSARSILIDTIEVDDSDSTVDIRSFLFDAAPETSNDQQLAETFVAAFKADPELANLPDLISRRVNLDEPNSVATAAAVSAGASASSAASAAAAANTAATAARVASERAAAAFGYALTIDSGGNLVLLLPPDVDPDTVFYRLERVSDGALYDWGAESFTALPIADWTRVSGADNLPLINGTPPGDRLRIGVLPGVDGPFEFSVVDSGVAEGSELAAWTLGYTASSGEYTLPSQGFRAADHYSVDAVQVDTAAVVGKLPEDDIAGQADIAAIETNPIVETRDLTVAAIVKRFPANGSGVLKAVGRVEIAPGDTQPVTLLLRGTRLIPKGGYGSVVPASMTDPVVSGASSVTVAKRGIGPEWGNVDVSASEQAQVGDESFFTVEFTNNRGDGPVTYGVEVVVRSPIAA